MNRLVRKTNAPVFGIDQNTFAKSPCPSQPANLEFPQTEVDDQAPNTTGQKKTLSYTMKVSVKKPNGQIQNDQINSTAINNNASTSGQQTMAYECTPQKRIENQQFVQQKSNLNAFQNSQNNNNILVMTAGTESDSKKFRRISDKSQDHQRFFKNLVEAPANQIQQHQIQKSASGASNATQEIGSIYNMHG